MRIYKSQLLSVILLMTGHMAYSQTWIPLGNSNNTRCFTINIIASDLHSHKAKVSIHGIYDKEITQNGEVFHQLSINGGSSLAAIGEPQLPTITQLIAIPEGATYKVSVSDEKWQDIEMDRVYPTQEPVPENKPVPKFFSQDKIYRQDCYTTPLVTIGKEQNWRNIRNVAVTVCPFKYYPAQKKLSVMTEYVLNVDFENVSKDSPVKEKSIARAISWKTFDNDISSFPVEKDATNNASKSSDDYDLLIIVGNLPSIMNSQAMNDFRKWKAFKGYKTKLVSTTTIGSTPNDIKQYIEQEASIYNIDYVLLVGDHDQIPLIAKSIQNAPTYNGDYWYGCFNGDNNYEASVPIGRFPTNTLSEFQNMVNKTINYEKSFDGNYRKTLLMAHKMFNSVDYQHYCDSIKTLYSSQLEFTTAYGAPDSLNGNNATNAQVLNYINSGMHIVNYRGHGGETCWGYNYVGWNTSYEFFTSIQVDSINTNSIYFSICCSTGNIAHDSPCLLESFMRSQNGAIACLGVTYEVYTFLNDDFFLELFKKYVTDGVYHFGDLNVQTHIANQVAHNNEFIYLYFAMALGYICGGDPTLELWTGTPSTYNNVSLTEANNCMTISSSSFNSNDVVCIVSDNGELMSKTPLSGNQLTFQKPSGNFYVAVNRHNYYPYIIYCNTTSNFIQNETIDIDCVYEDSPLSIGYDVTTTNAYGNVLLKSGKKLKIKNGSGGVLIKNRFECEKGAQLVIE